MKKTVLLNASTIVVGGGIQACVSFIRYVIENEKKITWHFSISSAIASELKKFDISMPEERFFVFNKSPARYKDSRLRLLNFERQVKPSLVFTFFGPAYVKFTAFHLCGVADGWTTHATRLAYSAIDKKIDALKMFMLCAYKGYWYRFANRWWVEAEVAREGLNRRFFIPREQVFVIPNACGEHYNTNDTIEPYIPRSSKFRCLTFSAYYPNKNLRIIPKVARELINKGRGENIEFIITLPESEPGFIELMREATQLGVNHMIVNAGKVAIKDGPSLYRACDMLFMPSLLETYSACYPEAMTMGLPIVTTDMDFAKNICADAALYYSPQNPIDAAEKIDKLIRSPDLYEHLRFCGHKQITARLTANEKNQKLLDLVISLIDDQLNSRVI